MPKTFSQLHNRWLDWLKNDPVQSIWKQIYGMVWDDATFRALNEARALTSSSRSASQNGTIARFVDSSYVAGQALALARLVDRRTDVISLGRLLDDIGRNRTKITRVAYLEIADLPYDYRAVGDAALAKMVEQSKDGVFFSREATSGPDAWSTAQRVHSLFDSLSGVQEANRQPDDCVSQPVIDRLEGWLRSPAIERIVRLRHKFVAHAADLTSRSGRANLPNSLTMKDVDTAHRAVFRTAASISAFVLYDDSHTTPLPTPQFDQFEFWDRAVLPTDRLPDLYRCWKKYEEERETWADSLMDDLIGQSAQ